MLVRPLTLGNGEKPEKRAPGQHARAQLCVASYTYYNFCRIHKTLRTTPAIQAGISDYVWSVEELVALLANVAAYGISC
jgi:hypothetical protein